MDILKPEEMNGIEGLLKGKALISNVRISFNREANELIISSLDGNPIVMLNGVLEFPGFTRDIASPPNEQRYKFLSIG